MCPRRVMALLLFSLIPAVGFAGNAEWRKYVVQSTGANVDVPVNIFTEDAGEPEGGIGRRFFTSDRRADLTVQSVPNPENRLACCFSGKKAPTCRYSVPTGDVALFRSIKHSQRANLVQSLQSRQPVHELRFDQLSRCRRAPVGCGRHTDQSLAGQLMTTSGPIA